MILVPRDLKPKDFLWGVLITEEGRRVAIPSILMRRHLPGTILDAEVFVMIGVRKPLYVTSFIRVANGVSGRVLDLESYRSIAPVPWVRRSRVRSHKTVPTVFVRRRGE
jgi:hypothetical protein